MRKIEYLNLDGEDATGLAAAAGAPSSRAIEFTHSRPGSDAGLMVIAKAFPKLERLKVPAAKQSFSAVGIRALAALPNLSTLEWQAPGMTDEIAAAIAELPHVRTLVVGENRITEPLTDAQLASIATMKNLENLLLHHISITPTVVDKLRQFRSLRRLEIVAPKVRASDIATLQKAMPRCTVLKR